MLLVQLNKQTRYNRAVVTGTEDEKMMEIRYVQSGDKEFWYSLDEHLPEEGFEKIVRDKRGYILSDADKAI